MCALSLFLAFATAQSAKAVEASGQVRVGGYTRSVEFAEPIDGESSNDEKVYSAQLRMSIYDFSSHDDTVQIDLRDKVDNYGALNSENLTLENYNRFQAREVAYKRPWESNRLYFTLGRFSLIEANVLDNDGAEVGYRMSRDMRFGLFGGQAPKDVITPYYVNPGVKSVSDTQGGVYLSYDKKNGLERELYTNNAIAIAPTYNLTDKDSHTYFYHMALWEISQQHRISSFVQHDFVPTSALRRANITYTYTGEKVKSNVSLLQTNTEDYLIRRDILDPLAPSPVQTLSFDLRHRMLPGLSVDYSADYSRRTVDGKNETGVALGVILPKLLVSTGSFRAQYGMRNNYLSKDKYIRGGYEYWNQNFSISLIHTASQEDYEDGFVNHRQVTNLDAGFFLNDRIRGSLGYQREKDDKVSANALFVMLGYRFGKGTVAPVRTKPALFEEI